MVVLLVAALLLASPAGVTAPLLTQTPITVHVSSISGSDTTGDGSLLRPFASPTRAASAVRGRPGSTVLLRPGFYGLPRLPNGSVVPPRFSPAALAGLGMPVLDLYADDSGAAGAPITYAAAPEAAPGEVLLSAGDTVQPSKPGAPACGHPLLPVASVAHVVCADLKVSGITDLGHVSRSATSELQLFIGSRPLHLARYPNVDPTDHRLWRWMRAAGANGSNFKYAAADADRIARWVTTEPDPWIHAFPGFDWHDDRLQLTSVDPLSRTATVNCTAYGASPCPEYPWVSGARWLGFNLLSELDEQGEYYLDRNSSMLYWWPPPSSSSPTHDTDELHCTHALTTACATHGGSSSKAVIECDHCVAQHQAALKAAGCTAATVQAWCTSAPQPSHAEPPPPPPPPPPAYVTVAGVALHVAGGRMWDRPVHHLIFANLTFAHGRHSAAVLREVANISMFGCSFVNTVSSSIARNYTHAITACASPVPFAHI